MRPMPQIEMKGRIRRLLPGLAALLCCPAALAAAEATEDRWGLWFGAGRFFNLLLVVAVVVMAARKPLAAFFAGRSESIREQLAEAQKARREAEARLAEMEERMGRLDEELRALRAEAEQQAQDEYRRLEGQAEREAEKVLERAREEIAGMTRAARIELQRHTAELSVKLAEEKIRREISEEDRKRLFEGFVNRLGGQT